MELLKAGPAGGGGIIRDCQDKMHYTFSANFGSFSAFRVEMKAVEISIDIAKRMGVQKLMIQMDSHSGIEAIQSIEPCGGECIHIVHQYRETIKNHSRDLGG